MDTTGKAKKCKTIGKATGRKRAGVSDKRGDEVLEFDAFSMGEETLNLTIRVDPVGDPRLDKDRPGNSTLLCKWKVKKGVCIPSVKDGTEGKKHEGRTWFKSIRAVSNKTPLLRANHP